MVQQDWGIPPDSITRFVHGTTIATNSVLERKGARIGLITTEGFRDVLEIRTLRMPRLYDLAWTKPPALVERVDAEVWLQRDAQRVPRMRVAGEAVQQKQRELQQQFDADAAALDTRFDATAVVLRKEYAPVGQPLSWERMSQNIAAAVGHRPELLHAARVIVSVGISSLELPNLFRAAR